MLMWRYYIFPRSSESTFPVRIRLHKLLSSDPGDEHDHPWSFVSLILRGGYLETIEGAPKWHRPGSIVRHRAEDRHRLTLPPGGAWSLVFYGPKRRTWGFYTPDGWIPWYEYPDEVL